eukprot:365458-Chlamydomonas_euryale.AAC.1
MSASPLLPRHVRDAPASASIATRTGSHISQVPVTHHALRPRLTLRPCHEPCSMAQSHSYSLSGSASRAP